MNIVVRERVTTSSVRILHLCNNGVKGFVVLACPCEPIAASPIMGLALIQRSPLGGMFLCALTGIAALAGARETAPIPARWASNCSSLCLTKCFNVGRCRNASISKAPADDPTLIDPIDLRAA